MLGSGSAAELGIGLSMAQQFLAGQAGMNATNLLTPADVARRLSVPEPDALAIIESGELPATKIGSSNRVKRSELDAYLSR